MLFMLQLHTWVHSLILRNILALPVEIHYQDMGHLAYGNICNICDWRSHIYLVVRILCVEVCMVCCMYVCVCVVNGSLNVQ